MLPSFFRFDHGVYTTVTLSFLFPAPININILNLVIALAPTLSAPKHTFNTIRLGKLRAIYQQLFGHILPVLALRQPHVDMRRRQIVCVEPHILVPAMRNQLFICRPSWYMSERERELTLGSYGK
jgi:hypothetical protein